MAKITSPIIKCDGHAGLPKYVFVISMENRSFDHLFGRSGITGKDIVTKERKSVNGVLKAGSTDPMDIDPQYTNTFEGKTYRIAPENGNPDPPFIMPGDPHHEYEHILAQVCGGNACKTLFKEFKGAPDSQKLVDIPESFYDTVPPPPQCNPFWVRYCAATSVGQGTILRPRLEDLSARPAPDNSGFVHSWVKSYSYNASELGGDVPDKAVHCPDPQLIMRCFNTKMQLPIIYQLASQFLICDNFFSSTPGPTGPNRFFMMAGSSAGYDASPTSGEMTSWETGSKLPLADPNAHIFSKLDKAGVKWCIYGDDNFPMAGVLNGINYASYCDIYNKATNHGSLQSRLKDATDKNPFPYNFVWIEPDYDVASSKWRHPMYSTGNSMHPCSDVRKGEQLIADIFNWIHDNKSVWENCVIFLTWDEHGGFYDHVIAPPAPPPGDSPPIGRCWSFKFDRFGARVPCIVISPFIESNLIDSREYDHVSILQTVIDLNNAGAFNGGKAPAAARMMAPWTKRFRKDKSMVGLFTQDPAKYPKVALATPLEPAPLPKEIGDGTPPAGRPTGNMLLFAAAAANMRASADPSFDPSAALASLTSYEAAANLFSQSAQEVDSAQAKESGTAVV